MVAVVSDESEAQPPVSSGEADGFVGICGGLKLYIVNLTTQPC